MDSASDVPEAQSRRILVLVHNPVHGDARVLKGIKSAAQAGHVIDVVGASATKSTEQIKAPDGAHRFTLIDISAEALKDAESKIPLPRKFRRFALKIFLIVLTALLGYALLTRYSTETLLVGMAFLSPTLTLLVGSIKYKSNKKVRRQKVARGVLLFTSLILSIYLAGAQVLSIGQAAFIISLVVALIQWNPDITEIKSFARFRLKKQAGELRATQRRLARYETIAKLLASEFRPGVHEVVHCHDLIALIAGAKIKREHPHVRLVWDAHEYYEAITSLDADMQLIARHVIGSAASLVDEFISISESFISLYAKQFPELPAGRLVMNATVRSVAPTYRGRLHAAAGLPRTQKILLFQGGLAPHRGISKLLNAAPLLPEDWSVVFMGSGKLESDVRDASLKIGKVGTSDVDRICLIPPVPHAELPYWTAGATLGIIPYEDVNLNHRLCTPNKLWEYPAAGVPFIATDLVEINKFVKQWGTGFLLPNTFDHFDIADAVRAISEQELEKARSNCKRQAALSCWEIFEPELLACYTGKPLARLVAS